MKFIQLLILAIQATFTLWYGYGHSVGVKLMNTIKSHMRTLMQHELFYAGVVFVIGIAVLLYEIISPAI